MTLVLDDIAFARPEFRLSADITLEQGERVAIIGPSGGGKSTLLSVIAGFDLPDRGRVLWEGEDLTPLGPEARPVSMLFQDNNLFPHLDVETNVALGLEPVARPSANARKKAREALARVGLTEQVGKKPGALSGGQQSRAALARLVMTARPLVLLDEPFAALGPALRREMWDLLRGLLPEATVLMVTHDPDEAARSASQIIFVEDGAVRPPQETAAFFATVDERVRAYLS